MSERKCKRCGACCWFASCDLYEKLFGERKVWGKCPMMVDAGGGVAECSLLLQSHGPIKEAFKKQIGIGQGCCAPSEDDRQWALRLMKFEKFSEEP